MKDANGNLRGDITLLVAEASGMNHFHSITLTAQHAVVRFEKALHYPEVRCANYRIDYVELENFHNASNALARLRMASREMDLA